MVGIFRSWPWIFSSYSVCRFLPSCRSMRSGIISEGHTQSIAHKRGIVSKYMDLEKTPTNNLNTEVEKLRIELHKKDEELVKERQEKEKLSADLDMEKVRAKSANELKTALASAHETNTALQKILWKSFPSECFYYYIKVKVPSETENLQYQYLYVDEAGHLRLDDRDRSSFTTRYDFDFKINDNGSFSIKGTKYMQPSQYTNSSRVEFTASEYNKDDAGEFVLFFHPQNQQAGLLVDISSTAGSFLCLDNDNYIVANSSDAPANKFLIVPAHVPVRDE